ncbi:hypothetical protein CR513_33917, partial [Mucuna pruriens]
MNDNTYAYSSDIHALARGPLHQVRRFTVYNVNGYKFRTLQCQGMKTQNNGVYASSSDNRPAEGLVLYYGKLVDIIELNYSDRFMVTLFKCQWANTTDYGYIEKDVLGFTLINFSHLIHSVNFFDINWQLLSFLDDERVIKEHLTKEKIVKNEDQGNAPLHISPSDDSLGQAFGYKTEKVAEL